MTTSPRLANVLLGITAVWLVAACAIADDGAIHLGNRLEPLVDDFLIEQLDGARQVLHHPTPREVAVVHDSPWEGNTSAYHTVFQDGDLYRMYYRGSHSPQDAGGKGTNHEQLVCYAESRDGVRWTKPELGLFEFDGSKKNNIVWMGTGAHNFAPMKDANPQAPAEAKYKALGSGKDGLFAFRSPDGLHWSPMSAGPVITKYQGDACSLRRFSLRTDGFVSVQAPLSGGTLLTKVIDFGGPAHGDGKPTAALVLNYATSAAGSIRCEIQKPDGTPLPGFALADCDEIYGDHIEQPVTWRGSSDLAALAGQSIRLRFVLKDADLYSIRFKQ